MTRGQLAQVHVVVDVAVTPFPFFEHLKIRVALVAYRAMMEFTARPGEVAF